MRKARRLFCRRLFLFILLFVVLWFSVFSLCCVLVWLVYLSGLDSFIVFCCLCFVCGRGAEDQSVLVLLFVLVGFLFSYSGVGLLLFGFGVVSLFVGVRCCVGFLVVFCLVFLL